MPRCRLVRRPDRSYPRCRAESGRVWMRDEIGQFMFLSSLPRGERIVKLSEGPFPISTHASVQRATVHTPTWGAPILQNHISRPGGVSTHTPTQGATNEKQNFEILRTFLPTASRGSVTKSRNQRTDILRPASSRFARYKLLIPQENSRISTPAGRSSRTMETS